MYWIAVMLEAAIKEMVAFMLGMLTPVATVNIAVYIEYNDYICKACSTPTYISMDLCVELVRRTNPWNCAS